MPHPAVGIVLNVLSGCGIVFANKLVFYHFSFNFPYALTFTHTLTTLVGMQGFLHANLFEPCDIGRAKLAPLAAAYVAYIVFGNISLQLNPVSFYQMTKVAVVPAVVVIERIWFGKKLSAQALAAVILVCVGVTLATVSDPQLTSNLAGLAAGVCCVAATALYQIWAGSLQRELGVGSMQLLHRYLPLAAGLLAALVVFMEPLGLRHSAAHAETLLGYQYTFGSLAAIGVSSLLGLLFNLSTFLVLGATSSVTYNVFGNLKTVIVLCGGFIFFQESISPKKLAGMGTALVGIAWYTSAKLGEAKQAALPGISLPRTVSVLSEGKPTSSSASEEEEMRPLKG